MGNTYALPRWNPRRLMSLPHLLVALWALLLLWGERWVFERAVEACEWETWERWVSFVLFLFLFSLPVLRVRWIEDGMAWD